jgi:hypothetical protein
VVVRLQDCARYASRTAARGCGHRSSRCPTSGARRSRPADNESIWVEASTVRDGVAARVVDRHADETLVVRVMRIKPAREDVGDFELPELHEVNAPRALLG